MLILFFRACEFLFEMLRVQSMEANCNSAIDTIDTINKILSSNEKMTLSSDKLSQFTLCTGNQNLQPTMGKLNSRFSGETESIEKQTNASPECFGFEGLSITPKVTIPKTNVTPGKESGVEELDSCQKLRLANLKVPWCQCLNGESACDDAIFHRLCTEAGIVIVEFLTVSEMKINAYNILDKLLVDNKEFIDFGKMVQQTSAVEPVKKDYLSCRKSGLGFEHFEPSLKYLCLEASCIQAEAFSQQKQYKKVHQIWHDIKKLQQSGFFDDVLHSNILVARLALCEASSFLHSLQTNFSELELETSMAEKNSLEMESGSGDVKLHNSTVKLNAASKTDVCEIQDKLEDLTLNKRTVTFGDKAEVFIVEESKPKSSQPKARSSRKQKTNDKENYEHSSGVIAQGAALTTPVKNLSWSALKNVVSTPNSQALSHTPCTSKTKLSFQTPLNVSNRKMALDLLLEDSDDDIPVFPDLKPVTPKTDRVISKKSAKSKTEPKKSKKKAVSESSKGVICNLTLALQQSSSPSNTDDKNIPDTSSNIAIIPKLSNLSTSKNDSDEYVNSCPSLGKAKSEENVDKLKIVGLAVQKNDKVKTKTTNVRGCRNKNSKAKESEEGYIQKQSAGNDSSRADRTEHSLEAGPKFFEKGILSKSKIAVASKTNSKEFSDNAETDKTDRLEHKSDIFQFDDDSSPDFRLNVKRQKGKTSAKTKSASKPKSALANVSKNSKANENICKENLTTSSEAACLTQDDCKLMSQTTDESIPSKVSKTVFVQENVTIKVNEEPVIKRGRKTNANAKRSIAPTKTRSTRGKKAAEEIEIPRNVVKELDQEINVSLDNIEINESDDDQMQRKCETVVGYYDISLNNSEISPGEIDDTVNSFADMLLLNASSPDVLPRLELEPIEVMRGDRKTTKGKGRGKQKSESTTSDKIGSPSEQVDSGVEVMRSSRHPSLKELSERMTYSPEASAMTSSNSGEKCA